MLNHLLSAGRDLLIQPCCPLCRTSVPAEEATQACRRCRLHLALPQAGLQGHTPLRWTALGLYSGSFRQQLLNLRRHPDERRLNGLTHLLKAICDLTPSTWLVPIPSWKQHAGNPLPALIAKGLGRPLGPWLYRRCASIGQHHLNRQQRLVNLRGAFRARPPAVHNGHRPSLWLVDDILTTGGTALAARDALIRAGHHVNGLICLARTAQPGCDLRSSSRPGDTPG